MTKIKVKEVIIDCETIRNGYLLPYPSGSFEAFALCKWVFQVSFLSKGSLIMHFYNRIDIECIFPRGLYLL